MTDALLALPFSARAALAFCFVAIVDVVWARYIQTIHAARPLPAAAYASVLYLLSATTVIAYTHDPALLLPAAAGGFFGTLWAVRGHR